MIHKKTAQQIVDTVKDVCGFDINFIDSRGLVLASTDPARIGMVHEGGRQVIARGGTLEVPKDGLFPGTKKGVNIPVFRDGILTAVIGGSIGCIIGMYAFRHKTRHMSFVFGMPAILIVQLAILGYLIFAAPIRFTFM